MRRYIYISAGLHVAIVLFVWIGMPQIVKPKVLPDRVMAVELVTAPPKETPPKPKAEPKPEPKKPEPVKEKPKPVPPKPEPKKAVPPPPKPKPEEKKKPKPKPKEKPKPKPEPKKEESFDLDALSALLDKTPDKKKPEPAPANDNKPAETQQRSAFDGTRMTASEIDAVRQQFYRCWNVPAGARNAEDLVVTLAISLRRDGSLIGPPRLIGAMDQSNPHFRTAAESAIRAVHMCSPLDLPPEKYDRWRDMELTFDPSEMLR